MGAFDPHMTFEALNLAGPLLQAIAEQGYTTPTPIQAQAIPAILAGHDLLAGAQTGTGKTAAFALPLLQRLAQSAAATSAESDIRSIRALVLAPTRELAAQVNEAVLGYAKHLKLKSTVIFGGVGMKPQIARIQKGVDVLVATPGRLLDLHQQGFVDLSHVEILVLDEADRMLDMGFIHDVKKILALVPQERQSLLFSATFSDEIRALAATLLRNPQSIQVTPRNTTVQRIRQTIHPVGREKKKQVLLHIIRSNDWSQVLVFTRTKFGANQVADFLNASGITAMALHGNKSQSARTQALAGFVSGDLRVLVATDIAARGIDIEDLPHVVNYEIPNVPEDYVHRIGRTGRAGREGQAVSLVCLDEEGFMQEIERFTRQEIPVQMLDGFGPDEGEKAEPIAMGRQTLWGGAGRPPSREVMQAAARAARQEMMQRIRANKAGASATHREGEGGPESARHKDGNHKPRTKNRPGNNANGPHARPFENKAAQKPKKKNGTRYGTYGDPPSRPAGHHRLEEQPPHPDAHLGTQLGRMLKTSDRGGAGGGQPDPMRTSVDTMTGRGRRKGFGGGFGSRSGRGFGR